MKKHQFQSRGERLLACVLCALTLAGSTSAQPRKEVDPPFRPTPAVVSSTPASDEWVRAQIEALDSDDLAVRDAASKELIGTPHLTVDRLIGELTARERAMERGIVRTGGGKGAKAPTLSAEAFRRLEAAAAKRFQGSDRGALGTSFSWEREDFGMDRREMVEAFSGVSIRSTTPGWDSARVLKPGDLVLQMSGVPISDINDARSVILSHDPGDRLEMLIRRDGRVLRVSAQLGRYSDLSTALQRSGGIDQRAWRVRVQRVTGGWLQHRTLRVAMTPLDERAMAAADRAATPPRESEETSPSQGIFTPRGVAVDGHDADAMPMPSELLRQIEQGRTDRAERELMVGGQARGVSQLALSREREILTQQPQSRARLEQARLEQFDLLAQVDRNLERVGQAMGRPGLDPEISRQLIQQHQSLMQQRAMIESRLDILSNALAQTMDDR